MLAVSLLLGSLLAGGPRPAVESPAPAERVLVFDRSGDRTLEGTLLAAPETTPPLSGYTLVERTPYARRVLADKVAGARFASDGAVLAVRGEALVELRDGLVRELARPAAPDFALSASGQQIVVGRPLASGGTALDLLDREGRLVRRLVASVGVNNLPLFTPDGSTLVFVSSRTGFSCVYRVGLDGKGERQLTNPGVTHVGLGFVPPPSRTGELRWEGRVLHWQAGGERFSLDVDSGVAQREGGAR